jgi:selenide,water dikinase
MLAEGPIDTDIVLLGGGHAHVHVVMAFARRPLPGVRVTLITRDPKTPYSGMLPGVIAGIYAPEEAHIDLMRLTALCGARFVHAEAIGLDRAAKRVLLAGRPPFAYDILSIDVGITPDLTAIEGAAEHGVAVKPIGALLDKLEVLLARCRAGAVQRIAVVGGGAGGVELLLSLRARLRADTHDTPSPLVGEGRGGGAGGRGTETPHLRTPTPDPSPQGGGEKSARSFSSEYAPSPVHAAYAAALGDTGYATPPGHTAVTADSRTELFFILVTAEELLPTHNNRVRDAFRARLTAPDIELHEHRAVKALAPGSIVCRDGKIILADSMLLATQAVPPAWFARTGLARDAAGFLAVTPTLQVENDPDIFAAGDCAALVASPREKAGVFAVRAGPPLAANLARRARGEKLRSWRPQRRHLALISTGERYAVASRGPFKAEGAWLWTLKDRIDRRWLDMYRDPPPMRRVAVASAPEPEMRCGGCAAKVGPLPLSAALARLPPPSDGKAAATSIASAGPEDAAVLTPLAADTRLLATVDLFRSFIDDPYVFGEIAANHALNDIFATGGTPHHALAIAMVPPGRAAKSAETLFQLLAGARACFDREGVVLVGGHSAEGDLALGFTVLGSAAPDRILRKSGLRAGDALVLAKPIGTGILFAAAMRGRADATWLAGALDGMRQSSCEAARIFADHGAGAMTDITGFGLAGHLGEMLKASAAAAVLDLDAIPLYPGARDLAKSGIASTLLPENLVAGAVYGETDAAWRALLFDPQTAGGLLAGIPMREVAACVAALRAAGYGSAAMIGETHEALSAEAGGVTIRVSGIVTPTKRQG